MADSDITITEIMYDPVNTVADNNNEWVEISNNGNDPVSLDGWTLDDSRTGNTPVGIIPNVTLGAGEIAIFYNANITEAEFIALNNPAAGTVLIPVTHWQPLNNSGGDTVNLFNDQGATIASTSYTDDASPGQSLNYTVTGTYEGAGTPDPGIVCFTGGSLVTCANGAKPIEDLVVGDLVQTLDHGLQPLRWIGQRHVSEEEQATTPVFRPVLIRKSAFGAGVPSHDTMVSQQHRILLSSTKLELLFDLPRALSPALALTNGSSIVQVPPKAVTYYHLLFDRHEILLVDGLLSESFHPTNSAKEALSAATRAEIDELFPEAGDHGAMPLAYAILSQTETTLLNQ